ncbi:amylo-alpha-1,6-glucosidase [bacterium]
MARKITKSKKAQRVDLPELHFDGDTCGDLERVSRLEWLETNGLGGYASSTITGMNTRRYHGLLVAAINPPADRMVALSKLDETIITPAGPVELATNCYPDAVSPEGYKNLVSFGLDPFPRWIFRAGDYLIEKEFILIHGHNTAAVRYSWLDANGTPLTTQPRGHSLSIQPFIASRSYHHLRRADGEPDAAVIHKGDAILISAHSDSPDMVFLTEDCDFEFQPEWYYNFEYEIERGRGLDHREDLLSAGNFSTAGQESPYCLIFASVNEPQILPRTIDDATLDEQFDVFRTDEIIRRTSLLKLAGCEKSDMTSKRLVITADQFIVERGAGGNSIIAGYHWFTDWGRDAMIALPGLAMSTGRNRVAKNVLDTFASHIHEGLIPNRFPDSGEGPAYNTVDAPLWYIIAADTYLRTTKDYKFLKDTLWQAMFDIVDSYRRGTLNGIRMDDDGLITAGDASTQLTWMDAKVGDTVMTPRHGKAVEINALWYNALRAMERLADRTGEKPDLFRNLSRKVSREFSNTFWNREAGCLFDVINEDGVDAAIRPNQIFALSLPRTLLTADRRKKLLTVIERDLLTPYGLRSLSPNNPNYEGIYEGGVIERDGAYHQGTTWAWFIGHYVAALLNVHGKTRPALKQAAAAIEALETHLTESAGLNSISEIFDGDPPHTPRGCIAQAWSVAELIRAKTLIGSL